MFVTYVDPRAVPRIVWGLRNLQNAFLNSETFFRTESDPAAPLCEEAWQHPLSHKCQKSKSLNLNRGISNNRTTMLN